MLVRRLYRLVYRRDPPDRLHMDYGLGFLVWKFVRKWMNAAIIPYIPFNGLRIALYRLIGYKIGKHCFIGMRCYLDDRCPELLTIGDHVDISYCVKCAMHGVGHDPTPITIGDYCFIGLGSILISGKKGITLGEGVVVGAGSLVNKSVPDWKIVAGNPARIIRDAPRGDLDNRHDPKLWERETDGGHTV